MTHDEPYVPSIDPVAGALLGGYLENRRKEMPKLRAAVAAGDFATVRRLGHNLKGSGQSYGLPPVSEIGARIEEAALASDAAQAASAIDALEQFLVRVVLPK